jgi:hypothetical protein
MDAVTQYSIKPKGFQQWINGSIDVSQCQNFNIHRQDINCSMYTAAYYLGRTTKAHDFLTKCFPSDWTHCFHLSILIFQVCVAIINSTNLFLSTSGIYSGNYFRLQFHFHPMHRQAVPHSYGNYFCVLSV